MKTVEEILKDALVAKDKGGDLADHIETVAVLRDKRWTWREIAQFLNERGVSADHTKVYRFAVANQEKINQVVNRSVNMSKSNQAVVPTSEEYVGALNTIKITDAQRKMLAAHYRAHNRSITYTELANSAGYDKHIVANRFYGELGRALGENLGFKFLKSKVRDAYFYSSAIGSDNPNIQQDDEEYQLIMHHELSKALDKLGWFN